MPRQYGEGEQAGYLDLKRVLQARHRNQRSNGSIPTNKAITTSAAVRRMFAGDQMYFAVP